MYSNLVTHPSTNGTEQGSTKHAVLVAELLRWSHVFKFLRWEKVSKREKRTITCLIASVSRTKITQSNGSITLWMWMFSTVLHLLVYSLAVAFRTISYQCQGALTLLFNLRIKTSSRWHQNCPCLETIHFPSWVAHSHFESDFGNSSMPCER